MTNQTNTNVVIIGGGLTGLTLGYYLNKRGVPFKILEKSDRVGGVIQTHEEDGFKYESGPNTGVIGNPEVADLFEELQDKCKLEIANPAAKRRLIWKKGKWHALPSGPISAISTPLFKFKDKLRILGEPFRKKGTDPMETLASMVRRRLGKSFLDYAINPFVSGVYAGDPEKLVTKYALPKMYNLEYTYGSLIKGGIKRTKEKKKDPYLSKATREVFSAEGGLGKLIKALEDKIGQESILSNTLEIKVNKSENGYTTSFSNNNETYTINSKYVVTTTGAYTLPSILSFMPETKLAPITNLNYAKIALVILGYKEWFGAALNAFGGLVPSKEKKNLLGMLFTSSFFKGRAPNEGALISIFIGGTRLPNVIELSDEEITELALANVNEMLETNLGPDLLRIFRYEHAIPQYEASTKERLLSISEIESEYNGLILAGNIRDGIGMADRIKQGKDIAGLIINDF